MKIRKRWFVIGGGALLVLFMVIALARPKPGKTVQVTEAAKKNLTALVKAPGVVEPQTQVNISAELPGRVIELAIEEGDQVKKGDLLLRLDDATYRAQVAQARAQLSSAKARFRSAESTWKSAKPTYERRKKLHEEKLLSVGEMEDAEREYQVALSEFESANEDVQRFEAALESSLDQLAKTVYRSPISGTIIELNIEEGEIVIIGTMNNPGTRILAVADLERMVVKAEVDETDVVDVRLGQKTTIEVDALPDTSFTGEVIVIGHSARRTGGAATGETDFEVEVLFDERVPEVRPGMTADVEIETATSDSALSVPIQAVVLRSEDDLRDRSKKKVEEDGGDDALASTASSEAKPRELTGVFVMVDNRSEFREVTTGIVSDTDIEVTGDLNPGDKVITGPYNVLRNLRPDQKVKAEEEKRRRRRRP